MRIKAPKTKNRHMKYLFDFVIDSLTEMIEESADEGDVNIGDVETHLMDAVGGQLAYYDAEQCMDMICDQWRAIDGSYVNDAMRDHDKDVESFLASVLEYHLMDFGMNAAEAIIDSL